MQQFQYKKNHVVKIPTGLSSVDEEKAVLGVGNFLDILFNRIPVDIRKGFIFGSSLFEMVYAILKNEEIGKFALWESAGASAIQGAYTSPNAYQETNNRLHTSQWAGPFIPNQTNLGTIITT